MRNDLGAKRPKEEKKDYIYIAAHLVGNPSNYGYCYDSDRERYSTPKQAAKALWRAIGSDDGWVAKVDSKGKVIELYNASEDPLRDKRSDQEEIDEINKEWGFE